jgi:hypothetical protein
MPTFTSADTNPAVIGGNTNNGIGVLGTSELNDAIHGNSKSPNAAGVSGFNLKTDQPSGPGVLGHSSWAAGVLGSSDHSDGVFGDATAGGAAGKGRGVVGVSSSNVAEGVGGFNNQSDTTQSGGPGVLGVSVVGPGVHGHSTNQAGVVGDSDHFDGVFGVSGDPTHAGVSGHAARNPNGSLGLAGFFDGNVTVTGDIFLQNADCAEDFDIATLDGIEPGSVMVIGHDSALRQSEEAYDKRVAGVVSGGGDYKPGIVLDRRAPGQNRKSIALLGKVYCKADASRAPIEVGDLLTTSPTPGHAMKATDQAQAFGAVIGKALRPLREGQGLIPILVALQ